ncbi:MAG: inorganic phosphate transporter [Bacteroidales bacterium]|nr:inorganic phosphate transporter [Bacteroidales bacterium]MCF8457635.1 inorganic phosphate transporter [Bacteroidales bacterium]
METLFIVLVAVLFLLAISDLIVGVSNDAVNFLNSAIGAKAAPFWAIMVVASLGVLVGATFSSGMMEVARKGIFHPQNFYFSEIMFIFLAVMITDVILLDLFNTFGMPTSTTVSIVFELLGAAVAIAIIKINTDPDALALSEYINSAKALAIISGILLSVVVSFISGALVQYVTRFFFTFNFHKNIKYYGAIWGAISISLITYFILIKGAKGASYMNEDFIHENTGKIILYSLIAWAIILQLLHWLTKINILKIIVLVGTFALAMAFAGNDLVNFIGVPLAGFESFKIFMANAGADPDGFSMIALSGKVKTPTLYLVIAGLIMVITLWLSKKARSVVKTSLDLSSQDEVDERFGSSLMARSLVRGAIKIGNGVNRIIPVSFNQIIEKRFDQRFYKDDNKETEEVLAFDLVRASVNLVVASILIAFATSLKLPLSTTYVTFMVAMGTSLADQAWGRESAVYRITGVIAVIGGWFFTAFIAFSAAFLMALLISWGGIYSISLLVAIAIVIIVRTHSIHKRKAETTKIEEHLMDDLVKKDSIITKCSTSIIDNLSDFSEVYSDIIEGLSTENRKKLTKANDKVIELNEKAKKLKDKIFKTLRKLEGDSVETGPYYVQVLDYLREMAHNLTFISKPSFEHVNNNHKKLFDFQIQNLSEIQLELSDLFAKIIQIIKNKNYDNIAEIVDAQQNMLDKLEALRKEQIKRIKTEDKGTRRSMLYFGIIYETQNFVLHSVNLLKAQRDFIVENK